MLTLGPQTTLDRLSPKRSDAAWVAAKLAEPATRLMVMVDLKPVVEQTGIGDGPDAKRGTLRWFTLDQINSLRLDTGHAMFMGQDHDTKAGYFSVAISEAQAKAAPGAAGLLRPYVDLRSLAMQGFLDPPELSLAGQARSLAQWHETHGFCAKCGQRSAMADTGWKRKCEACDTEHFPRTDPVVIMLVTDGERCLLGHEKRFGQMYSRKFYSTLAGFLEPGEDIESAVRREVWEEAGIEVGKVHYFQSQPWPFPYSLMMGCIAEANKTEINIDKTEIEDARWFSRADALEALEGRHPELALPGPHAIAHHLIRAFVDKSWGRSGR